MSIRESDLVIKQYDEAKVTASFQNKLLRRSESDYINILKDDIISRLNETIDDKDFKTILGESRFGKIADYYNEDSDTDVYKTDLSIKQITKSIDWLEFISLSAKQQTAWLAISVLEEIDFTKASTITDLEIIFNKDSKTMTNILQKVTRKASRFEKLYPDKVGYKVTKEDIEDALR